MIGIFLALLVLVVAGAVGVGLVWLHEKAPAVKANKELDPDIPVEELHVIVKRQFVPYEYNDSVVLHQVVCACGWTKAASEQGYVRDGGDAHVRAQRARILAERETARKVAEKLAENEKGDFAW